MTLDSEKEQQSFLDDLVASGEFSASEIDELRAILGGAQDPQLEAPLANEDLSRLDEINSALIAAEMQAKKEESGDLRTKLSQMKLPEKVKCAMFGNAVCRLLLINDPNRLVQQAVLRNPKIRLPEIEDFAKSTNMSSGILRKIGDTEAWVKSYLVKLHLVLNCKTPNDVSLKWLRYLRQNDLKKIARSKNVPNLIAVSARKRLSEMEEK